MSIAQKEKPFDLDILSIADLPDVSNSLFIDKQNTQAIGKKYVVFMINDINYAIASDKISEVVRPMSFTSLPNVPDWFLGIANLRGDIISIIDLQKFLKLDIIDSPKSKLIVLNPATSNSHIAFKVDRVREIVTFPEDEIQPIDNEETPFFDGLIELRSNEIHLLDIEEILASLTVS